MKNTDICHNCGVTIPVFVVGPFACKLVLCEPCQWKDTEKNMRVVDRPFKRPYSRGMKDGTIPAWFTEGLRMHRMPAND